MKEFHFKRHLTKTNLDSLADKYYVKNSTDVEKYIMDFEILFHILKVLPDCVVKGGMAVTFHVDGNLKRLSEDIDIVTRCTKEEIENAIDDLKKDLEPLVDMRLHAPKKPTKRLPLMTYWCKYKSSTSPDSQIKLDIFYGDEEIVRPNVTDGETKFMEFTVDFPVSTYNHISLIVDKMTTLAFQTIGLPESRRHDAPKQIYDIASLLKSFSGTLPIGEIVDLLARISRRESGYCQVEYSFDEILTDLEEFSDSMVDDKLKLNPRDDGYLGTFKTHLLTTNYSRTEYVTDILLIALFIKMIRNAANKTQDLGMVGIKASKILARLKDISNSSPDKSWRRAVVRKYAGQERERVAQLPSRQLYLYDCIRETDNRDGSSNNPPELQTDL